MSTADTILVACLQSDEPERVKEGWAAWYNRDSDAVRRVLSREAGSGVDIDAIMHDAFIAAVNRVRSEWFRYQYGNLSRYVCVVALNLLRREQRLRRHTEIPFTLLVGQGGWDATGMLVAPATAEPATVVEARSFNQWLAEQVHAGLAVLGPDQRELFLMRYLAGRPSRELATERKIPASTLEVQLWRLRARLRREPALRRAWEMLAA